MSNISQFNGSSNDRRIRYALYGPAGPVIWTAPSTIRVNEVLVVCVGGGGAGGSGSATGITNSTPTGQFAQSTGVGGGGGGSGAIVGYTYPVSAGTQISLTAGGTSGTSSANNPGPAPIPISAAGGSSGTNGTAQNPGNGQSAALSGGAGGSGGAATIPAPGLTGNAFSAAGIAGLPGQAGRTVFFPNNNPSDPFRNYWAATGGAGGAGGRHDVLMNMLGITYSLNTGRGASYEGPGGTALTQTVPGPNPSTNIINPWQVHNQEVGITDIGVGGGGGAGAFYAGGITNPNPIAAGPGSVGAVFILY